MKPILFASLVASLVCTVASSTFADNPLAGFVPGPGTVSGATIAKGPDYYTPATLWNYIDGGALPYLDYGVTDATTYTLQFEGGGQLTVDVYAMADSLGAFGIFRSESYPDYTYIDIGVEGYMTDESAAFWKDRYYIKIFPPASGAEGLPIERTARTVDALIPDGGGIPGWFDRFPTENRRPHSETYTAKNVLGQDFLERALSATYDDGDTEYQVFVLTAPDTATAEDWLARYRAFIGEYGKLHDETPSAGESGFIGEEEWYGPMVFARRGNVITGTVGLADRTHAETIITILLKN